MELVKNVLDAKRERREKAKSKAQKFKSHIEFTKRWTDKVADTLTAQFGTVWFLIWHAAFFAGWIEWNLGLLGLPIFDPFPFGLLTMVVSLEAIGLAITVLISQNRQNKLADMRQQMDFEIDVRAEEEITKILRMLHHVHDSLGISSKDQELREMERHTDIGKLQHEIERENSN